jgi:WD40 repeat protein
VTVMCLSKAGDSLLYQGSEDLCVRAWDIRQGSPFPAVHMRGYVYFPLCMDIHSSGHYMATGCKGFDSTGCEVKLWDLRNTSKFVSEYVGHGQDVTACKFSEMHSNLLVSGSKDGSVIAWDTTLDSGSVAPTKDSITRRQGLHSHTSSPTTPQGSYVQNIGKAITGIAMSSAESSREGEGSVSEGSAGSTATAQSAQLMSLGAMDGSLTFMSVSWNSGIGNDTKLLRNIDDDVMKTSFATKEYDFGVNGDNVL